MLSRLARTKTPLHENLLYMKAELLACTPSDGSALSTALAVQQPRHQKDGINKDFLR